MGVRLQLRHVGMGIRPAVSRQCLAFFWQIVRQGHDWNITLCQVLKSLSMTFLRSVKHHLPLATKKEEAQSQGEKRCQDIGHVIPTVISLGFNAIQDSVGTFFLLMEYTELLEKIEVEDSPHLTKSHTYRQLSRPWKVFKTEVASLYPHTSQLQPPKHCLKAFTSCVLLPEIYLVKILVLIRKLYLETLL